MLEHKEIILTNTDIVDKTAKAQHSETPVDEQVMMVARAAVDTMLSMISKKQGFADAGQNNDGEDNGTSYRIAANKVCEAKDDGKSINIHFYEDGDYVSEYVITGDAKTMSGEIDAFLCGTLQAMIGQPVFDVACALEEEWVKACGQEAEDLMEEWSDDALADWYANDYVENELSFVRTELDGRWFWWPEDSITVATKSVCMSDLGHAVFPSEAEDEWKHAARVAGKTPNNDVMLAFAWHACKQLEDTDTLRAAWKKVAEELLAVSGEYEDMDAVQAWSDAREDPYYGVDVDSLPGGPDWDPVW